MKAIITIIFTICMTASCKRDTHIPSTGNKFIGLDTANRMINSYLRSIDFPANDSDLRAITISADEIRIYLADTSIREFKIMLAHTQRYINSGNENKNTGYNSYGLTFILAGVNSDGDYVFHHDGNESQVLNRGRHCPSNCPVGSASNPLLTAESSKR